MNEQWRYFLHQASGVVMKSETPPENFKGWVEITKEEYYRRIDEQTMFDEDLNHDKIT